MLEPPTDAVGDRIAGLLESAEAFARHAGQVTLRYFRQGVAAESKDDGTPVTIADREAEMTLRNDIRSRYPDHGILGEEYEETNPGAATRWILDPIDGTLSFVRGVPLYGVLVGIEIAGEPACGVAHFPAIDETVVAGSGLGCYWNGRPTHVSARSTLAESLLLTTSASAMSSGPRSVGWSALRRDAGMARTWGDAYGHALVATGRAEIMVDPELAPWDAGPLPTILREAGGRFTSLDGVESIYGQSGVSTNGTLHSLVLERLGRAD
jgi:histidinol-phosphatase